MTLILPWLNSTQLCTFGILVWDYFPSIHSVIFVLMAVCPCDSRCMSEHTVDWFMLYIFILHLLRYIHTSMYWVKWETCGQLATLMYCCSLIYFWHDYCGKQPNFVFSFPLSTEKRKIVPPNDLGPVLYSWLCKFITNEIIRYICNIHWAVSWTCAGYCIIFREAPAERLKCLD